VDKVLLIVPPVSIPKDRANFNVNFPIGLGYIAAVLEQASYEVIILDTVVEKLEQETLIPGKHNLMRVGLTFEEITRFIRDARPNYVGITSMFSKQHENAVLTAQAVKNADSEIPVIVGGAHATADPNHVIEEDAIDVVVVGEGENIFLPLLEGYKSGNGLHSVEGLAFIDSSGKKILTPRPHYPDVEGIPFPARHLFPMEKYFAARQRHGMFDMDKSVRSINIETSRGCPFDCNFCSVYQMFGKDLRCRSADSVLAEIDELVTKYNVNDIYLVDDQFLAPRKRALSLLDGIISRNYGITFDAPNGLSPWILTEEILVKMKAVGFWRVNLAVESGNEWVLKNIINKPVNLKKLPEVVRLARENALEISAFIVVGNISENAVETFAQMKDSFDLMRKLNIGSFAVSYLSPHAGSEAYDVVQKMGYLTEEYDDNYYSNPSIASPLWTTRELEAFVEVQRVLCFVEDTPLAWPVKLFTLNLGGLLLNQRYRVMYFLINFYGNVKSSFSSIR